MSSVTVEINGRETVSQAALQASGSMKKMGEDSKGFLENLTITAGDVVGAIQKIASSVSEVLNLYAVQERAVINLNSAIELSDNVNKDAAEGLIQYASELQALTGIGDETTIAIQAMLIASGRSEEQTRSMIAAAADYSAATGKDFKTTIEDLNKSFSGTQGRMGQLIPELKDLTEEQLKGGAAIDIVGQKYAGYAERLSGSASVALASFNSSWNDMKESLGEAIMPAVLPILGALVDLINDPVIPVIKSFAPIVKEVFENVEKFITDLKPAVEPIMIWFANTWTTVIGPNIRLVGSILKETLSIVSGIITGDWKRVWDSFKQIVLDVVAVIKNAFGPLIDAINLVVGGIDKAKQFLLSGAQGQVNNAMSGSQFGFGGTGGNRYARGTGSASPGVAIVGEEGPELVIMRGGETVIPNDRLTSAAKSLGIPGYAKGTSTDSGFGFDFASPLMELISSMTSGFGSLLGSLGSIKAVMDPLGTILGKVFDVIGPMIDQVIQPLMSAFDTIAVVIGEILTPIFKALTPIFVIISNALMSLIMPILNQLSVPLAIVAALFEILTPIMKANAIALEILTSPIKYIGDLFKWVAEVIRISVHNLSEYINNPFNAGRRNILGVSGFSSDAFTGLADRIADIWNGTSGVDSSPVSPGSGGTTGGNATYQKPRDLTVNVQVYTSALVGNDGISEFSLIIGRELKAAGVLNMS